MFLPSPNLAFMFDLGGEPPPSFFYEQNVLFFLSVIALPLGYWALCRKMARAAISNPPRIPYFCVFGSVGGYLLIAALSPSVFTLLILPFLPLSLLSLIGSLIYLVCCRPFTSYHLGAAICCGAILLSPFAIAALR